MVMIAATIPYQSSSWSLLAQSTSKTMSSSTVLSKRSPLTSFSEKIPSKRPREDNPSIAGPAHNNMDEPTAIAAKTSTSDHSNSSANIRETVQSLFGQDAWSLPNVSARVMACLSMASTTLPTHGPLWKFCKALVDVETISLKSEDAMSSNSQESPLDGRKKTLTFCGFDCSSSLPPIDRVEGSEERQEELIHALIMVQRAVLDVQASAETTRLSLQNTVHFLSDQENHLQWQLACAKAIDDDYPIKRIQSAWGRLLQEFQTLQIRVNKTSRATLFTSERLDYPYLPVEQRLAHFLGQAMRRELRNLLNPPPPRGCSKDTTYEQRAALFSQASTYVLFKGKGQGAAAADKNLATLVSRALQALYEYFGLDLLMQSDPQALLVHIPKSFCASEASMKEIPAPTASLESQQESKDWEQVLCDIHQATGFLSAVSACRFLVELFSIQPVCNEVERRGGWSQMQTYAATSWQYQLYECIAEDSHLVVLANAEAFLSRLQAYKEILLPREDDCHKSLLELSKRKRLATKSHALLQRFPQLQTMQDAVERGRERSMVFPRVQPTKQKKG